MENINVTEIKICPKCGKAYSGYPAISRVEPYDEICSLCGTREALESIGLPDEECEKIITIIENHTISNK